MDTDTVIVKGNLWSVSSVDGSCVKSKSRDWGSEHGVNKVGNESGAHGWTNRQLRSSRSTRKEPAERSEDLRIQVERGGVSS